MCSKTEKKKLDDHKYCMRASFYFYLEQAHLTKIFIDFLN